MGERWQPFATRDTHKPIPRETLFEFLRGHDRFLCELRDHGRWGVKAQFYQNEEFFCGRRFDPINGSELTPRQMPFNGRKKNARISLGDAGRTWGGALTMDKPAAVIDALERAPSVVLPLVREVSATVLKRRPSPRKWSAHEHACHLAVVHKLFFDRLDQMLATPSPVITPYEPSQDDADGFLLGLDLQTSLNDYVEDRRRLVERLRQLAPADWSRTAEHGEYNHYSVFIMFRHLALHDFFHAYRIEELLLKKGWPSHSPE